MNDDARAKLQAVERRQAWLRRELADLDETLAGLKAGIESEPAPAPGPPPVAAPPPPPATPENTPVPGPVPLVPGPPPLPREPSLEMRVGTVWLARIGIVIVLTGLVFLANYAWKSLVEHFGAAAKLALLYFAGGGLLAAGLAIERGRESLRGYARVLVAGGMAAIYYTTYAAYFVPSLKVIGSPLLAGVLLVALAVAMGWMAERRDSQATAVLAIALAFYASAVNPIAHFTLASNAILGVAAVVLMARKRWMGVPFLALAATYWSYAYWRLAENWRLDFWRFWEAHPAAGADLGVRVGFLSVYWLVFTAGVFLVAGPGVRQASRVVFSTLNDAAFFCLAALAISSAHRDSLWLVALAFGLAQSALALADRGIHGRGSPAGQAWLAKALFFLTLAVLVKFTGNSLAVILAVECSLLVFAARRFPSGVLMVAGPLAGVLAAIAGVISLHGPGTAGAAGLVAALLAGNAWLCRGRAEIAARPLVLALCAAALGFGIAVDQLPDPWEAAGIAFMGLGLVSSLPLHKCRELAFAGLLAEAGSALLQLSMVESAGCWPSFAALALLAATAAVGPLVSGGERVIKFPCGVLAIASTLLFWAWACIYIPEDRRLWIIALAAAAALAFSRERPLRQAVAAILAAAAFLVFLAHGIGPDARYSPWNLLGCLLLLGQERLARHVGAPLGLARFAGVAGLACLLAWVTSAVRFFHDPLPLTAAWALLALAIFLAGFLLRARLFRLGGLGILALALARMLLLDVWRLDLPFRILGFLVLGGVLLLLGYFYNRYADRIRQWL